MLKGEHNGNTGGWAQVVGRRHVHWTSSAFHMHLGGKNKRVRFCYRELRGLTLEMKETEMISFKVTHFKQKRIENLGWMRAVLIFLSDSQ